MRIRLPGSPAGRHEISLRLQEGVGIAGKFSAQHNNEIVVMEPPFDPRVPMT
jgi:hypothetical protein